jgi:glycosyltransferase involved in cell wall biosynthesis
MNYEICNLFIYECLKIFFLLFLFFICVEDKTKFIFNLKESRIIRDVLFISGVKENLPQSFRYRVLHQIEQLNAGYLVSSELFYLNLNPLMISDFRVIIFFRCPWNKEVDITIKFAKKLNKKILFDIDDLVFDLKYTNTNTYVQALSPYEKSYYDKNVILMKKTLLLCDGAITTNKFLAKELKNYIPEVFINHNVASEEMWKLSENALIKKSKIKSSKEIIIGYFSGSITHNSDIKMIIPALTKILLEFKNVKLLLLGILDLPYELKGFLSQIIKMKFIDWRKLPEIISTVDINIAPIEDSIFNEAKSENKWVEAAIVKVPTIASNIGEFKQNIIHGKTGLLCTKTEEWYTSIKSLITDNCLRQIIAENAFEVCKEKYNSLATGNRLANHINSFANKHIGFVLPSLQISGGIYVVLEHASFLQDSGWDVDLLIPQTNLNFVEFKGHKFNSISLDNTVISAQYDVLVATFYSTLFIVLNYSKAKRKLYLVQGYETDFFSYGNINRGEVEKTYSIPFGVEYITISKWCETWLREKYGQKPLFAPNGIDLNLFVEHKRDLNKTKIRILIEGDNLSPKKNVDESFRIVEKLNKNKYEIWYMSYNGKPKKWYRVDKFLSKIPYQKVRNVYEQCDILIKSSYLESFSYPPLEMMATGGFCIVAPNKGNIEYLKDEENCLFYKLGDIQSAIQRIERLISDVQLQKHLYENGLDTSKKRDWKNFKKQILSLYE